MRSLCVSESHRYLTDRQGNPFFYMGDTAWEIFHRLSREEADYYLKTRADQGFTVIQAVALAEFDGLDTPNFYGRRPLKRNSWGEYDPTLPDQGGEYDYWQHVDFILDKAAEYGLYVGLLPTWGDKYHRIAGEGPVIFTQENAFSYGKWLAEHCRDRWNILWILGGDRHLETEYHYQVIDAMARGLREGDKGRFPITFHPCGARSSSEYVHSRDWLDFNMMQSGHGLPRSKSYEMIRHDYELRPIKPVLDGEHCYEDHPVGFNTDNGYYDAADVRCAMYWNVFSGACGNTYGHHSIWSFNRQPVPYFPLDWKTALHRPGAESVSKLRALLKDYPTWQCTPEYSAVTDNRAGANYIACCRCERFALLYTPCGVRFHANPAKLAGYTSGRWYDVRTGEYSPAFPFPEDGWFAPPATGRGMDWVLVLEVAF